MRLKASGVPAACFSLIFAATASLLRCISAPVMELPAFWKYILARLQSDTVVLGVVDRIWALRDRT